jgi:hypothetical protein
MRKYKLLPSLAIFAAGFALSAIIGGRHLASLAQGAQGTLSNSPAPTLASNNARQPSTSQKWEYRVVAKYVQPNQVDIDFELNRLGEQGYEVCSMAQSGGERGPAILTITLRRPR